MNKTKAVKDLLPGECFTLSSSRGTVYRCERVTREGRHTVLVYTVPAAEHTTSYVYSVPGLTTATLV